MKIPPKGHIDARLTVEGSRFGGRITMELKSIGGMEYEQLLVYGFWHLGNILRTHHGLDPQALMGHAPEWTAAEEDG